jgi:hypothetical protein
MRVAPRIFAGTLILGLAVVSGTAAMAQTPYTPTDPEWAVSGFVGPVFSEKFQFQTSVSGEGPESSRTVGMEYETGYVTGVRIAQNLNEYWGADLEYSFANQRLRFLNLSPAISDLTLNHYLHHLSYSVAVLPLPRMKHFRPYVNTGIGAAWFYLPGRVKKDAAELGLQLRDSWEMSFRFGGGFKYRLLDELGFVVDVRDTLSRIPSYGLPSSARTANGQYQPGIDPRGLLHNVQFSVGFSYQWDEF